MKQWKAFFVSAILTIITLSAIFSFIRYAPSYLGKDYFESNTYVQMKKDYVTDLEYFLLNVPDEEATINELTVTDEEIIYYKEYYGSQTEQITDITYQYEDKILEAKDVEDPNEEYINALIKERDEKIADITKNFTDKEYVRNKILMIKEEHIRYYFEQYREDQKKFFSDYQFFGYDLINKKTGENITENVDGNILTRSKETISLNTERRQFHFFDGIEGIMNKPMTIVSTDDTYTGTIFLTTQYFNLVDSKNEYRMYLIEKWVSVGFWLIGLVALILLCTKYRWRFSMFKQAEPLFNTLRKIPIDGLFVIVALFIVITANILDTQYNIIANLIYGIRYTFGVVFILETFVLVLAKVTFLVATILLIAAVIQRLQSNTAQQLWNSSYTAAIIKYSKLFFLNRSIAFQTIFMFFVFYLGGFGLLIGMRELDLFLFYSVLFIFILLPTTAYYLWRMSYLNEIMNKAEGIIQGKQVGPIKVRGNSIFAKHARNLNMLQEGVQNSAKEQAKSERLKTELITNVSHDLRTPLTSIITYTDLLKNPDLTPEERAQYVQVLDKKAERLKILIEDLFEVSKMASGTMQLSKQQVDVAQLLQQIVGEHVGDFEDSELDLRVSLLNNPLFATIDAQKLWRVCDNLLNNARKYSLKGTRVYVDLREEQNVFILTVKNVSHYELDGDATELVERFKRADLARHTEGSGLGLAIATSIVHLHDGSLDISADGDLFKVTVKIPIK